MLLVRIYIIIGFRRRGEGGTIVIRAACPEGLGAESGFVAALRGLTPPWAELLSGPEPVGAGAQRAVMLARLAQRFELEIEGCRDPGVFREVGIRAHREAVPRPSTWLLVEHPFQRLPQYGNPQTIDSQN